MVRFRQLLEHIRHRFQYLPIAAVVIAVILSQVTLRIDGRLTAAALPLSVATTGEAGRSILSTVAGGLIASVVLLLSMMVVAVQLASSQFSPRTVRNLTGDRNLQFTIGLVLGTAVYCLLVLRETRTLEEGDALLPHMSVVVGVGLGLASLVSVVQSVDRVTNRLRVGVVAGDVMDKTIDTIDRMAGDKSDNLGTYPDERATDRTPSSPLDASDVEPPSGRLPGVEVVVVEAGKTGWIQQIDIDAIADAIDDGATAKVEVPIGSFALEGVPLVRLWPEPVTDECRQAVERSIAIGDGRTLQQDVSFGITQMVDIALRALSPGINDPNTVADIVVHLGAIVLRLWSQPARPNRLEFGDRVVLVDHPGHGDHLHDAFDPIRRYGSGEPLVVTTLISTVLLIRSETERRNLPGPIGPLDDMLDHIVESLERSDLTRTDKDRVLQSLPPARRARTVL